MIEPAQIDSLLASVDIVQIVGERVKLRKAGASFKGLCPFHGESTPSFSVTPATGRWHCFGCDAGGDAIAFLQRLDGLSFLAAVAALSGGATGPMLSGPETPAVRAVDPSPFLAELWRVLSASKWLPEKDDRARRHEAYAERWLDDETGRWETDTDNGAPWSPLVAESLQARSIEPDAAYALGCRDWSTRRAEIGRLIDATPTEILEAAGLARGGKLWAPLDRLGDPSWAGVAVPVWRIGEAFPNRWRWRFSERPYPDAPKSMSSFSAGSATDFLGAGKPSRLEGSDIRVAHLGSGSPGAETLLIVEGEPDWLSATEAIDGRAIVVAVCGAPIRWRDAWPPLKAFAARGVTSVAVCVHEGSETLQDVGHGLRFAEDVAVHAEAAGLTVRARLPAEGHDLNDLHRAGELCSWLREVIA